MNRIRPQDIVISILMIAYIIVTNQALTPQAMGIILAVLTVGAAATTVWLFRKEKNSVGRIVYCLITVFVGVGSVLHVLDLL